MNLNFLDEEFSLTNSVELIFKPLLKLKASFESVVKIGLSHKLENLHSSLTKSSLFTLVKCTIIPTKPKE
jgi:hypothetical protein